MQSLKYMSEIIIKLETIKFKEIFFAIYFFKLLSHVFFFASRYIFKFYLVNYAIKFCYNLNAKYY